MYDFSFAVAYIALMKEYGATDVMLTGLYGIWADPKEGLKPIVEDWPDPIRVSYLDEVTGAICYMRTRKEIEIISAPYTSGFWTAACGIPPSLWEMRWIWLGSVKVGPTF